MLSLLPSDHLGHVLAHLALLRAEGGRIAVEQRFERARFSNVPPRTFLDCHPESAAAGEGTALLGFTRRPTLEETLLRLRARRFAGLTCRQPAQLRAAGKEQIPHCVRDDKPGWDGMTTVDATSH